ncbi:hypothetical protein T07_5703, partial [Trichinella nelsoni]
LGHLYPLSPSPLSNYCCTPAVYSSHNLFRVVYGPSSHPTSIPTDAPFYDTIHHSL